MRNGALIGYWRGNISLQGTFPVRKASFSSNKKQTKII